MHFVILFICFFSSLIASDNNEEKHKSLVVLPRESVFTGDYFASKEVIEISGEIFGDAYLSAGDISIDGHIHGDLLAFGGNINVSGTIDGNIRVICGQFSLSGHVGKNVTLIAGSVNCSAFSTIAGNSTLVAASTELAGTINQDSRVLSSNLRVSGTLNNVEAYVGQLRLTSRAEVLGQLEYSGQVPGSIDPQARIHGPIVHHPSITQQVFEGKWLEGLLIGSKIAALLMNLAFSFVIGVILIKIYPERLHEMKKILSHNPWQALGAGVLLLILFPLVALLLLITILGIPFALAIIALNVLSFYAAKCVPILFLTDKLPSWIKLPRLLCFFLGLFIYFVLGYVPILGTILTFTGLLFGLGAYVLSKTRKPVYPSI